MCSRQKVCSHYGTTLRSSNPELIWGQNPAEYFAGGVDEHYSILKLISMKMRAGKGIPSFVAGSKR